MNNSTLYTFRNNPDITSQCLLFTNKNSSTLSTGILKYQARKAYKNKLFDLQGKRKLLFSWAKQENYKIHREANKEK